MLHKPSQGSIQDMFSCKAYLFFFRQIIEMVNSSYVVLLSLLPMQGARI